MATLAGFLQRLGHGGIPSPPPGGTDPPPPPPASRSDGLRSGAGTRPRSLRPGAEWAWVLAGLGEAGRERERAGSARLSDKEPAPSIRPHPRRAPAAGALPGRSPRAAAPKPGNVARLTGDEPSSVWSVPLAFVRAHQLSAERSAVRLEQSRGSFLSASPAPGRTPPGPQATGTDPGRQGAAWPGTQRGEGSRAARVRGVQTTDSQLPGKV
ncbi:guanine nucleotide-binding protein G(s) subunit alpha isoforms XLas-like [Odocoileus virginianus]|uniref:Guanine nucleotide-binding protein G(S) subunit alpha isoforms XLas-like n=1 Tax=Odocoileus virginianus TaxID=9874 RepID=A0ABM4IKM9_ODOVR